MLRSCRYKMWTFVLVRPRDELLSSLTHAQLAVYPLSTALAAIYVGLLTL